MELLCPSCQKKLTIPDQYAGQLMKCPLCQQTFTAPALPSTPAPAFAPPPPPPIHMEPLPPPPPPPRTDAGYVAPDGHEHLPALPPVDEGPPPPPGEYSHFWSVYFSPKVLQWVPAPALFIVFVLTFFPWVGVYPGGVYLHSQNAYLTAFGGYSSDHDLGEKDSMFEKGFLFGDKAEKPGFSVFMLFFLLAFFPALLLAIGALALVFLRGQLPPGMKPLLQWRWAVVAGFTLIALGFLGLQMLFGFNLEQSVRTAANKPLPEAQIEARKNLSGTELAIAQKTEAMSRGLYKGVLSRTLWLDVVVFLLVVTLICSLLLFWIDFRGNKPLPRVDLIC